MATRSQLTEDDMRRLNLPGLNPDFSSNSGPLVVNTPAVLHMVLQNEGTKPSLSRPLDSISLSGLILHRGPGGLWQRDPLTPWHDRLRIAAEDHIETFTLARNIGIIYHHDLRRWFIFEPRLREQSEHLLENPDGSVAAEPAESVKTWIRRGGLQFAAQIQHAAEDILSYFSDTAFSRPGFNKLSLLDDSVNEAIGVMIRGRFCSAIAQVLVLTVLLYLPSLQPIVVSDLLSVLSFQCR